MECEVVNMRWEGTPISFFFASHLPSSERFALRQTSGWVPATLRRIAATFSTRLVGVRPQCFCELEWAYIWRRKNFKISPTNNSSVSSSRNLGNQRFDTSDGPEHCLRPCWPSVWPREVLLACAIRTFEPCFVKFLPWVASGNFVR